MERAAHFILQRGLAAASLRPLASACGVSDRMLLYYFRDKDELIGEALARIAGDLAAELDELVPHRIALGWAELLADLASEMRTPRLAPQTRLWLDIAAGAGRGDDTLRVVAGQIAATFTRWIGDRLDSDEGPPIARATLLLATLDGLSQLDAAGQTAAVDAALLSLGARGPV